MQVRVRAGPPQIIKSDFHPRNLTTSRWLLHEIKKAGWWLPCISTTGGWRSKPSALTESSCCSVTTAVSTATACALEIADSHLAVLTPTPAALQAAGFEIPALLSAAAIFACCVIAVAGSVEPSLERSEERRVGEECRSWGS